MKKSIIVSMLLFSTTIFAMEHSNNKMNHSGHMHNMSEQEPKKYEQSDIDLAKKGKKVFETMCDKNSFKEFNSKHDAMEFLQNSCKELKDDRLKAASTYLYIPSLANDKSQILDVPKDAKCPVCGMFPAKYPKWATAITVDSKNYYFDGVKDMMKFYFEASKYSKDLKIDENVKIIVTDYYTLEAINAKEAFFVSGSNVYGPMGEELIPFKNEAQAKNFFSEHFGKEILKFNDLKKERFIK